MAMLRLGLKSLAHVGRLARRFGNDAASGVPGSRGRVVLQETGGVTETALLLNTRAARHDLLFTFQAPLVDYRNRHSLQYNMDQHLCSVPRQSDEAFTDASDVIRNPAAHWVFMNHAFVGEATVYLCPVEYRHIDPTRGCVAVYAAKNLSVGDALTFDYTLQEFEMSSPFTCHSTGRQVQGFRFLTPEQQEAALPHAWPHVRQQFDSYRGLSLPQTMLGTDSSWLLGTPK